ncbi:MAG TPA: hypothetical protein VNS34_03740 [Rhizobiaceae bacterium]|nr:hypothetical protein [Rhizobiaceae bacterium]
MADFVAVLRKTIDGLGDTTPEMRRRVYDKARATVAAKLAALNPQPPAAVAERQKKALEDAIAEIEASFPPPPPPPAPDPSDPLAELESVFASLRAKPAVAPSPASTRYEEPAKPWPMATPKPVAETPKPAADTSEPVADSPKAEVPEPPRAETPQPAAPTVEPAPAAKTANAPPPPSPPFIKREETAARQEGPGPADKKPAVEHDEFDPMSLPTDSADDIPEERSFGKPGANGEDSGDHAAPRRRGFGRLIAAVLALAVLGGGGYAAWLNKDRITALMQSGETKVAATPPAEEKSPSVLPPPETPPPAPQANGEPQTPKFTQRLNTDGTETDPGPAGGEANVGEGTSVAAATAPGAQSPDAPVTGGQTAPTPGEASPSPAPGAPPVQPPAAQIPVGQKAIFYEERTASSPGSAESGSVVWSVVQESPGNDLPPEPAIRGEATIPSKDLQLRMTIRRNADQTLPASHIIELIFLTPDGFGGGGIDNILRFALKGTEEAPGSPVRGIPAKIADGFFLVALNESKADADANMNLLRNQDWIDVPVTYKNGRRALITMEKGIPGAKVFEEAMKAWQDANAG